MRLTKHFPLHDLIRSSTAAREGIDNTPSHAQIERLRDVSSFILERCRVNWNRPITPSSGFRCFELEKVICRRSIERYLSRNPDKTVEDYLARKQHPTGMAVDFEVPGVPNLELAQWIEENCEFDQLLLEFPSKGDPHAGWVHASFNKDGNRRQVLTITSRGTALGLVI